MLELTDILPYIQIKTARSGGSGGQHINKAETKVTFSLDLDTGPMLSEDERSRLQQNLRHATQPERVLRVASQESRSQHRNKEIALRKMLDALNNALREAKPRKKTKPSKGAIQSRLDAKKRQALKKINRGRNWD